MKQEIINVQDELRRVQETIRILQNRETALLTIIQTNKAMKEFQTSMAPVVARRPQQGSMRSKVIGATKELIAKEERSVKVAEVIDYLTNRNEINETQDNMVRSILAHAAKGRNPQFEKDGHGYYKIRL
jgi:uncharacterized protein YydD (DUF2326 family)